MIKTFKSKSLAALWQSGKSKIDKRMHRRILIRLAVINEAAGVDDINLPGYNFHSLHGFNPQRFRVKAKKWP